MFYYVSVLAFISCAFAATVSDVWEGRIVNGEDANIQSYPYQVSLQTNKAQHVCGGCIISEDIIVTAAHCMQNYKAHEFKVRLGATEYDKGGELVAVKAFRYHEDYNNTLVMNDVAVIKLSSPVRESSTIRYLKLARRTPPTGTQAVVTGWGTSCFLFCSISKILQKVELDIINQKTCASADYKYGSKIRETMVCAAAPGKDSCQGDSGGPLVSKNELVGIVSWGNGCGWKGYPGVYCAVSSVRDWIEETARLL